MDGQEAEDLVARATEIARTATEDDEYEASWELLGRVASDADASLRLGIPLLGADSASDRATGCALLGLAADVGTRRIREEVATAILALAESEADDDVQNGIAMALGRCEDPRGEPVLLGYADHADPVIRFHVAFSLPSVVGEEPSDAAVQALIRLTADEDGDTRNWATFGLGDLLLRVDSPEVREALWARVSDDNADARAEGIHGLALRRDPRSVALMAELLADEDGNGVLVGTFRAAKALAAPELVPYLRNYDEDDFGVAGALAACEAGRTPEGGVARTGGS
jgi:HEAT repeat protein